MNAKLCEMFFRKKTKEKPSKNPKENNEKKTD